MANAAAKKAKTARDGASNTYKPIFFAVNALYAFIRIVYHWETWTRIQITMSLILWALTYLSYNGIIEDCANQVSATSKGKSKGDSEKLAGGAYLDLFGLVVVVQFGSVLWSNSFYWLLSILPFWGGFTLYKMFKGDSGNGDENDVQSGSGKEEVDEALAERRRKRAEKRRQKRA